MKLIYLVKHPKIPLYITPIAQKSQNSKPIVESHNNDVIEGCQHVTWILSGGTIYKFTTMDPHHNRHLVIGFDCRWHKNTQEKTIFIFCEKCISIERVKIDVQEYNFTKFKSNERRKHDSKNVMIDLTFANFT